MTQGNPNPARLAVALLDLEQLTALDTSLAEQFTGADRDQFLGMLLTAYNLALEELAEAADLTEGAENELSDETARLSTAEADLDYIYKELESLIRNR